MPHEKGTPDEAQHCHFLGTFGPPGAPLSDACTSRVGGCDAGLLHLHYSVRVLLADLGDQQSPHASTSAAAEGMTDLEFAGPFGSEACEIFAPAPTPQSPSSTPSLAGLDRCRFAEAGRGRAGGPSLSMKQTWCSVGQVVYRLELEIDRSRISVEI